MNCWHLSIVTPPAIEPVTLDQALSHCSANSGIQDDDFRDWIRAAREEAERFQRRAFIEQTLQLSFDNYPVFPIYLPRPPVTEVTSVKMYDIEDTETVVSVSDFLIDYNTSPARMTFAYGNVWPDVSLRDLNAIQIQYTAGYGDSTDDVPRYVKKAILFYVAYMYENRAAEVETVPKQFYHILSSQRMYL